MNALRGWYRVSKRDGISKEQIKEMKQVTEAIT